MDPVTIMVVSVVLKALLALLVDLVKPDLREKLKERGLLGSKSAKGMLTGTGLLRHAPRKALPRAAQRDKQVTGYLVVGAESREEARQAMGDGRELEIG